MAFRSAYSSKAARLAASLLPPLGRFVRRATILAAAFALLLPATAASGDDERNRTDRLVVAVTQTVDTFNPFMSFFAIGYTISGLVYDSLIDWDSKDFSAKPSLATGWTVSPDRLTWTFNIRSGVKFSDGTPLTAKDVEFTFHTMMTNEDARASASDLVENFASVDAPDDTTFVVRLKEPTNQMLALDNAIVPRHIWKDRLGDLGEYKNFDFPTVGSGPFQVVEYETDQFIRLKANPDYWGGAPAYDELVFRHFKNADAPVQALQTGEVDLVSGLLPAQYKALEGEEGITLNRAPGRRTSSITFNVGARTRDGKPFGDGHPALKDPAVRQALHHAIDKQELIRKVDDGMAEEGVSYIPPIFSTYFWQPSDEEKVRFDLDEANRILDEAGYARGPDGVRVDPKSGRPLRFRLLNHSDTPTESTDSRFLEGWWEKIGVDVEVQSQDSGKLNDSLYQGRYDIIFSGWGVGPDPTFILSLYTCGTLPPDDTGRFRDTDTFYCNPEFDRLHEQQKRETDIEKRAELVKRMQRILYTDAPVITLRYRNVLEAYRSDRWTGFVEQPEGDGMIYGQMGNWSFLSARPVAPKEAAADTGGVSSGTLLGLGAAAVVLAGGAAWYVWRRRTTEDERE